MSVDIEELKKRKKYKYEIWLSEGTNSPAIGGQAWFHILKVNIHSIFTNTYKEGVITGTCLYSSDLSYIGDKDEWLTEYCRKLSKEEIIKYKLLYGF